MEFLPYLEQNKLNKLTVARLKEFAKEKGLVSDKQTKGNLIAAIEEFY